MQKKVLIGIFTTLFGLFVGYFVNEYRQRPEPSLIIERVEFKNIKKEAALEISLDEELVKSSERSQWMDDLDATISFDDLNKLASEDLPETVRELRNMAILLPTLIKFVSDNRDKKAFEKQYLKFLTDNATAMTLTYLTMNIAGSIRRGEFEPKYIVEEHPEAFGEMNSLLKKGMDGGWDFGKVVMENDKSDILGMALLMEWHPGDLEPALRTVRDQVSLQLAINQPILEKLKGKLEEANNFRYQDFVNVSALVVNSGDKTITIDQYAALSLPTLKRKFFLISDTEKGQIAVPPGEVRSIQLRSDTPLNKEESKNLTSLYNTKIIDCQLTMRLVTQQEFTPCWIHSKLSEFSGDTARLKTEFLEASLN